MAAGGARSSHKPNQKRVRINGLFFFLFNGVWTLSLGFIQAGPRALWHLECKSPSHALIITTGRQLGLKYRFFHNKGKLQRHKKRRKSCCDSFISACCFEEVLEAGKEPKSSDLPQNRGEKWDFGGFLLHGDQDWLIPRNSPSGTRTQQQKRVGNREMAQLCWHLIISAKQRMREVNRKGLFCIFIILWGL